MKLYQYPKCSTCRKAAKFLKDKGVEFTSIDITEQPPTINELNSMLASYDGQVRKLFNTSGVQYRELNMKEKMPTLSAEDAVELLSGNGKLIKRPFLLNDSGKGIVGFKDVDWNEFI